ncbi:hypothetical protein WU86_09605 [Corynebacterium xerosis]|nr:hypothetical protein WU86_09605 [Corynebacterium xerosis]
MAGPARVPPTTSTSSSTDRPSRSSPTTVRRCSPCGPSAPTAPGPSASDDDETATRGEGGRRQAKNWSGAGPTSPPCPGA